LGSFFINLFSTTYETLLVCYLVEQNLIENKGINLKYNDTEIRDLLNDLRSVDEYRPLKEF